MLGTHKARMAKPLPLWSRSFEASSNIYPEVESALSAAAGITLTPKNNTRNMISSTISLLPGILTYLFAILVVVAPIYYVIFRNRFMFAFFTCWFFMIVTQQAAVSHSYTLYEHGLLKGSPTDTTTVGLTVFSGWILAYPYCGLLFLIRLYLVRSGFLSSLIVSSTRSKQDLAPSITNNQNNETNKNG